MCSNNLPSRLLFISGFKCTHIYKVWDGSFIEVTGESLPEKVIIGNLYRPPRHNDNNETIKQFCQDLAPIISKVSKSGPDVIITGDFNIDLLQINDRSEYQKYFNLFVANGFFSKITFPQ